MANIVFQKIQTLMTNTLNSRTFYWNGMEVKVWWSVAAVEGTSDFVLQPFIRSI